MAPHGNAKQTPAILSLAKDVLRQTEDINNPPETIEYQGLCDGLKTTLEDLLRLVEGPKRFWREFCCLPYEMGAFQVALDFEFFTLVPASGAISVQELAQQAGIHADRAGRIIRQLITYGIFAEHQPGLLSHTPTSLAMQDDEFRSMVHYSMDEMLKAAADSGDYLRTHPYEADSKHNPFVTHHGCGIFEYYAKHPDKAERFAKAMAGWRKMNSQIDTRLLDGFDWAALKGTVVDVGGGNGHISRSLAERFPHLDFVVQDSNRDMLNQGVAKLTDDIRDRVSFAEHSFFEPQPQQKAAAFLIRQCIHNWADRDAVTILKSLVPGLESSSPDTPLLINDIILPELGAWPKVQERQARKVDMVMFVNCGAKQRTKAEFEALLKVADARYEIRNVFDRDPLGMLEVYLARD
ncbi:hypothetical protein PG993_003647 [Apiospora rasikravindrae]|uniref:O-methyltransferase C-terminal domain-containing protein n=1 Tax=Apiospora rasikravindrae TaxID=990691 RepID=A0ABR1U057_9PEZI